MGYRRITRGRKAPGSKGKSNGTSKFKTRYRKMRGGDGEVKSPPAGATLMSCVSHESHLGGVPYNDPNYDMHGYEDKVNDSIQGKGSNTSSANSKQYVIDPSPHMLRSSSKVGQGLKTEYVYKRMRKGFFNQSTFFFQRASLFNIGLIEILKKNPTCTSIESCKQAFFSNDVSVSVIHENTAYVFFGGFAKKRGTISYEGVKQGLGLCYNVANAHHGRLYMGYWFQDKMHGLGIEVDFDCSDPEKPSTPVGIYFGHFFLGKRKGFGIYYYIEDGKEKFVFYTGDQENNCVISASYPGDEKNRQLFEQTVRGSLKMIFVEDEGRDTRHVTLESYIEKLRAQFKEFIGNMGSLREKLSAKELLRLQEYQEVYTAFVNFCFDGVYKLAHDAYEAKRDEEMLTKKALEDVEKAKQAAKTLLTTGVDGVEADWSVTDLKKNREDQEKIASCVKMLKNELNYMVKSPTELAQEADALKGKKLEEYDELKKTQNELAELKQKQAFMAEMQQQQQNSGHDEGAASLLASQAVVPLSAATSIYRSGRSPNSRFPSRIYSPIGDTRRTLDRQFASSPSKSLSEGERGYLLRASNAHSGGKRTRKNMRMRMRRVKSRRSRRGGSQCGMMR